MSVSRPMRHVVGRLEEVDDAVSCADLYQILVDPIARCRSDRYRLTVSATNGQSAIPRDLHVNGFAFGVAGTERGRDVQLADAEPIHHLLCASFGSGRIPMIPN